MTTDNAHVPHEHAKGEPCPVIKRAIERFGHELGMELLWQETCFPFDDRIALAQLEEIIAKVDRGEDPTSDMVSNWRVETDGNLVNETPAQTSQRICDALEIVKK